MANYTGGDFVEITCNHPTLGNFVFATKSDEAYTMDPGGFRSDDDAAGVTGSGDFIDKIKRVRWSFEGPLMIDLAAGTEMNSLQAISASFEQGTWTFSHITGAVFRGKGKFVGDIQIDTKESQIAAKISGGGKMEIL
ncbi:structural protein [Cellulophaga phage phiSM]|nr:structural protein [Cellulophaga phage phiSM]